jgi:outer membrane protein OmpA-like peptidoglycan-associated protein
MKTISGINRITKATMILVLIVLMIQTGFGQLSGVYSKNSKKKSLRKKYKCEHIGVQKVKHIQGRSKQIEQILVINNSNETITASLTKTDSELIQPKIELKEIKTPVETESKEEEKKDSVNTKTIRLLPLPVYFRYDSYRLDIIDLTQIALAVTYVKEGHSITLIGHTDNWGSEKYNEVLSAKRANIIRDMMIELGCKPELISAKGEGEKYPVATNEHEAGRQNNRRVEFLIAVNAE